MEAVQVPFGEPIISWPGLPVQRSAPRSSGPCLDGGDTLKGGTGRFLTPLKPSNSYALHDDVGW
jgi:hypothetical protein